MKTLLAIFSSVTSVLLVSCAHESVYKVQSANSFRAWQIGPTQGQIIADKKFAPAEIGAEMECTGNHSDGSEWKETKKVKSKISKANSTSKEVTYNFIADAEKIVIPDVQLKSCAYFIKTKGPHPNEDVGSGRFPVAGDIAVNGMSDFELTKLLNDQALNLEINKKLAALKIGH